MEKPKFRLNVIIDDSQSKTEEHAKRYIKEQAEREFKLLENVQPRGIAVHVALYPQRCDACSETYWANDPYAEHAGCKRPSPGLGFR